MRSYAEIHAIAAQRKGGAENLEKRLARPVSQNALSGRDNSVWLEAMAKAIFQAGLNWSLIEEKWPAFQSAFESFEVAKVSHYDDNALDRLLADKSIVRNGAKIAAVIKNAQLLRQLDAEHGRAATLLAKWPEEEFCDLLELFSKQGARLGGVTGQRPVVLPVPIPP